MTSEQFKMIFCGYSLLPIRTPVFTRKNYSLCTLEYVLSGKGFLECNGKTYEIGQDSVYILHKGSSHKYWHDRNNPWQKVYLIFDGNILENMFLYYGLNNVYCIQDCVPCKNLFISICELHQKQIMFQEFLMFHQLLEQLFMIYRKNSQQPESHAEKLKKNLDESIRTEFLLSDYAKKNGFSEGHLIRVFRNAYGITPHLYLLELRLQAAKEALLYSDLSVKEIADKYCFANQYYFSNIFKQKYNFSPKLFRNKYHV